MNVITTVDAKKLEAKLVLLPKLIYARVLRACKRLGVEIQASVKEDKLSGQALHVRTGTLRRSINQKATSEEGLIKVMVGTNVSYAAVHEYGFQGTVDVRAHLRKISHAWGKQVAPRDVLVQAHTRQVNLPERSFLRSTIIEMAPKIRADISTAVSGAIAEANAT